MTDSDPTNPPDSLPQSDTPPRDAPSPPEPQPRLSAAHYNVKAKSGLKLMLGRQVFIQIFTFAGGIVLARTLTPEIFGVFGICMFLVHTLALFGDFGLAPSLIQRKEELTDHDLQVAFTLQQGLLTLVAVAIWIVAPYFLRIYPDFGGPEITWLIRVMAFTLFLQAWRSMSVLQMERHLDFKKIAWIEVVEALSYQGLAVALAVLGFGVWSLVWATLTRGLLGTTLAYAASPWPIRMMWDTAKAKEILRFGLPFQFGKLMNSAGGWVIPLVVGTLIGPAAVGFLTWAGSNGRKPNIVTGNIARVAFPHFSRLQDDWTALVRAYERYLWPPMLLGGLWIALMLTAAPDAVPLIYTDKWVPAIPALQVFAGLMALNMAGWITGTVLRSTGKIGYAAWLSGITTAVMIAAALALVPLIGFIAVPVAMVVSMIFKITAQLFAHRWVLAPVLLTLATRLGLATLVAAVAGFTVHALTLSHLAAFSLSLPITTAAYLAVAWLITPRWVHDKAWAFTRHWLGRFNPGRHRPRLQGAAG